MFSIVVPLYNKSAYILRSLGSILAQDFRDYEVIVVNDGSTDGSVELIERSIKDERIRIVHKRNGGVSSARNRGIQEARYQYIAFLDADDMWHPSFLSHIQKALAIRPELKIVGVRFNEVLHNQVLDLSSMNISPDFRLLEVHSYFKNAANNAVYHSSSTIVRKDVFDDIGIFDEDLTHGEDLDMWFRIMISVKEAFFIPDCLSFYFVGDSSQATGKLPSLEKHLAGRMLDKYEKVYQVGQVPYFRDFLNAYLLVNLRPFYMRDYELVKVQELLKKLKMSGGQLNWFYSLPRWVVKAIYHLKKRLLG